MKNIIKSIAVLATAALMVATVSAQNYSPVTLGAHQSVAVNPTTYVQVYPASFAQVLGFNGDLTNSLSPSSTGTNYVIKPGPQLLYIALSTNANFAHVTNTAAGTFWKQTVVIKGNTIDQTLTTPTTWIWPTNTFDTNHIIGKITTIQSNTYCRVEIEAVSTNTVLARAQTFR